MLDVDKALINVAACIKAYMIDHRMGSNNTGIMDVTDIDRESGEVIYDGEAVYTYFLSESLPENITVLYNDGQSEVCNCFK